MIRYQFSIIHFQFKQMAKKKKAKKLEPTQSTVNQSTGNRAATSTRKKKKSNMNLKQILIVGALALAMLAFIMQPVIRYMNSGGSTTETTNNTTMNETKADAPPGGVEPQFRKDGELAFLSSDKSETLENIDIEIVKDEASITQGLMWRKSMDENRGMLFLMPQMGPQSFWMKNTYIPLDIIFINHNKQIVTIQKNTTPLSEKNVKSSQNAQYVLEVNAGYCDKFGIKKGDFVRWQGN